MKLLTLVFILLPFFSFSQPTWVTSGAAIGDTSSYVYPASWASQSLIMNSEDQDSVKIDAVIGSPDGVHIYYVDAVPSSTDGVSGLGANNRYWGVFVVGGTNIRYDYTYYYDENT